MALNPYLIRCLKFLRRKVYEEKHLQEIQYLTFDLDVGVKVTRNASQYPLHHMTYSATKFEVATFNRLGGDTFTGKATDGCMDGQMYRRRTDFGTKLIYPFF